MYRRHHKSWDGPINEAGALHGNCAMSETFIYGRGLMVNGHRQGEWRLSFPDGAHSVGVYELGVGQGYWKTTLAGGEVWEGNYENGFMHGPWTVSYPDRYIYKGLLSMGKIEGPWTMEKPDGTLHEAMFSNDEMESDDWKVFSHYVPSPSFPTASHIVANANAGDFHRQQAQWAGWSWINSTTSSASTGNKNI
jgi:hypothetical protein